MTHFEILQPGDEGRATAFLSRHGDSSMLLLGNLKRAGLRDGGNPYEGTYGTVTKGDAIAGLAAHYWNGNLVLQAPRNVEVLLPRLIEKSGRPVMGLLGPGDQVAIARDRLDLAGRPTVLDRRETLFAIDLAAVEIPRPLAQGRVICRRPRDSELPELADWRLQYEVEANVAKPGETLAETCQRTVERFQAEGCHWVLAQEESLVAYCTFNAVIPDRVQVGGVFTPPAFRGRGFARAVIAGALLAAHAEGVSRAVLFTGDPAAERAYRAIGFREVGTYSLVIFDGV
jgi:RimJ/RimL family protein N-acetyltransferase